MIRKNPPASAFAEGFLTEASFGNPRLIVDSAWLQHGPFAFWLVEQLRPQVVVGLTGGDAFFHFCVCQAVQSIGLGTRCWLSAAEGGGDLPERSNRFLEARAHNNLHYRDFSTILTKTADKAHALFDDGVIDLLFIDGSCGGQAARHNVDNWLPKVRAGGVMLLHGIEVQQDDAGLGDYWKECSKKFPSFSFPHGNGLGMLRISGGESDDAVGRLCSATTDVCSAVRGIYRQLGESVHQARLLARSEDHLRIVMAEAEVTRRHKERIEGEWTEEKKTRENMQQSLCWRITKPLRDIDGFLSSRATYKQELAAAGCRREPAPDTPGANAESKHRGVNFLSAPPLEKFSRKTFPRGAGNSPIVGFLSGEPGTPGHVYRVERAAAAVVALGLRAWHAGVEEAGARLGDVGACDVLVIWRCPYSPELKKIIQTCLRAGGRVVYDIDDLMFDPKIANAEVIDAIRSENHNPKAIEEYYRRILYALDLSELCVCTTEALATRSRKLGKPAMVIPNGFDEQTFLGSRLEVRRRASVKPDGLFRLGYAGGTATHQRDFGLLAGAVSEILRENSRARLVLFRRAPAGQPLVDLSEYEEFSDLGDQIEWRDSVPLEQLPSEIARFDVNLAPLEVGNPFCEAKSELKFFEAALVGVPTVASPTGAYAGAICDGVNGFLAKSPEEWRESLFRLMKDSALRANVAREALRSVLWRYGPLRRSDELGILMDQLLGNRQGWKSFSVQALRAAHPTTSRPLLPETEILFAHDALGMGEMTVVVPVFNYENYLEQALESVRRQTLRDLDLVVIDDASTDDSLSRVLNWARYHCKRFNRLHVLRNKANSRLGRTRNAGFDFAETLWVLPLDADNLLRPDCAKACLETARKSGAAFVYPAIQQFGSNSITMGSERYLPLRFCGVNFIDAMACVSKEAWTLAGGYAQPDIQGWEDYQFWCRLAELGLGGVPVGGAPLADYRVHENSMLRQETMVDDRWEILARETSKLHPWVHPVTISDAS